MLEEEHNYNAWVITYLEADPQNADVMWEDLLHMETLLFTQNMNQLCGAIRSN